MAKKRIVVFADGTGNAFTTQASNVWRLYEAMDQSEPDQIARYIKGVGTSGFRPFALLDGATGFGVPGNVRKLYRFLCWNWAPGDEIYMFGFSRGAFTIRTLIGLMDSEGLVPRSLVPGQRITQGEMERNAMAAWRSYRAKTAPWTRTLPTIWLTRLVRNVWLWLYHTIFRHRPYAEVRQATVDQGRINVPVTFVGLFDTVEAYGVPIEELRLAVDWSLWPISFRNRQISRSVERVRHALALDDERTSFHPLACEATPGANTDVQEVWFAGMHSDVGGGYPDGALAFVPLCWMAHEAKAAGLRFRAGVLEGFESAASALGPMHDSRSGLSVTYRYDPRRVPNAPSPTLHHSVTDKMVFGADNYAPLTVPSSARVLLPGGAVAPILGFTPANFPNPTAAQDKAMMALRVLNTPNAGYVDLARDTIWWRRTAYYALLAAVLLALSLPRTADGLAETLSRPLALLPDVPWLNELRHWFQGGGGLSGNLDSISKSIEGFSPGYVLTFLDVAVAHPFVSLLVFGIVFGLYSLSGQLQHAIVDRAVYAWFDGTSPGARVPSGGTGARIARVMRTSIAVEWAHWVWSTFLMPGVAVAAIFATLFVTTSRVTFNNRAESLCTESKTPVVLQAGESHKAEGFGAHSPCWATGIGLEKGRRYQLRMEVTEPFCDRRLVSDVHGFRSSSWRYVLASAIRRWWSADWFQPIARVGAGGILEWPLVAADGSEASVIDPDHDLAPEPAPPLADWMPIPAEDCRRVAAARTKPLARVLQSEFTAPGKGELFLYLNDAIGAVPFGREVRRFYDNNSGRATVTVRRLPDFDLETTQTARAH